MNDILTIHEVRRRLDRALQIAETVNTKFLDGKPQDPKDLKEFYDLMRTVCSAKWTNTLL